MKSRMIWLYAILAIGSIILIALGISYMGNRADITDSEGNPIPEGIHRLFQQIDEDRDGAISPREFAHQVTARGRAMREQIRQAQLKTLQAQFAAGDKDSDGSIDGGEYARLVVIKQLGNKALPLAAYDTNNDGGLDFKEYVAFRQQLVAAAGPAGSSGNGGRSESQAPAEK